MAEVKMPRQRRATPDTIYRAVKKPPASFGYHPVHDFWNVLAERGPLSIRQLHAEMLKRGWRRPDGGELTMQIMQIDVVSMARPANGFAELISD